MVIGIRPTVDFAFKLVFGSRKHIAVTIHFLNAILGKERRITKVEILNPILGQESENDKLSVLDIRATDEHGRSLNIEMQTTLPAGMAQRLAYYVSNLYVAQMTERVNYVELRPAISICVLTKPLFPLIPQLHLDFRLRETSGQLLTNDLQIHLLELPKLRVTAENVRSASPIEQWAFFLQHVHELTGDEVAQLFPDPEFAEAAGVLEMIALSPVQQQLYDDRLKFQKDDAARLEGARQEGIVEGEARGEAKGILRGRIAILQELLGVSQSIPADGSDNDEAELLKIEEDLRNQLRNQLRQRGME